MSALQRLSSSLAQTLRLSSRQLAASQQAAAFHVSAAVEARRRKAAAAGSDTDSDEEDVRANPSPAWEQLQQSGSSSSSSGSQEADPEDELNEYAAAHAGAFDVQTLISPALAHFLERAPDKPEEADKLFAEWAAATEEAQKALREGREYSPEELATDEDLKLLSEAVDLYFEVAPDENPELDGFEEFDRAMLAVVGDTIKEALIDDGKRVKTINTAPPGRLPWEIIDVQEEVPMINWGVDFTEGRAEDAWKNALLSEDAKRTMWELHTKEGWDVPQLAEHFKIRQQRVMAILALKEKEQAARDAGEELDEELAEEMEAAYGAFESMGSGERHHVVLPSYPNYKELTEADADRLAALLEQRLGKPFDEIEEEDMTPEVTRELLAAAGIDKSALEEELAQKEEEMMVAEFKRALEYNTGKIGASLSRASRAKHPLKRPEGGWGLLVQPLGKAARSGERAPYVALPDGTQRALTEDERLNLERQAPRPRRKLI